MIDSDTALSRCEDLIAMAAPRPGTAMAETLADLRAEAAAIRAMTYRVALRDPATPFDGSLVRLAFAELAQRIHRTGHVAKISHCLSRPPFFC